MHAPFLSCCELWYGTNRICYDFILRKTRHLEFSISKTLKFKVPQWLWIPTKAIWQYSIYETLVICYLLLHWTLSNCCDPCWDSRHAPMIKTHVHPQINCWLLHWELHTNMLFRSNKIITPFVYHVCVSLKIFMCQKE